MGETTRTTIAFDTYRASRRPETMNEAVTRYEGDTDQMTDGDGLQSWTDGNAPSPVARAGQPGLPEKPEAVRLWVVTQADVLHAPERCVFGSVREARCVKHSNLTGGGEAYAGGELLFVGEHTIVVSGRSGRYRVRSAEEMRAVASAFRRSGYGVWSMGYNQDVDRPAMFGTQDPEWVAA